MAAVAETLETVQAANDGGYKWGFETDIAMEFAPKGLNEDIVRFISAKKNEPEWMLEWRLKAYAMWLKMEEPEWARRQISEDRLPGRLLLRGAEQQGRPQVAR